MTTGIGDPDVLARTIAVYTDVSAIRRALAIPHGEDVWAFVVTRDGSILARTHGDSDDSPRIVILDRTTGEILCELTLDPDHDYQPLGGRPGPPRGSPQRGGVAKQDPPESK